jgi:hypothetical protein
MNKIAIGLVAGVIVVAGVGLLIKPGAKTENVKTENQVVTQTENTKANRPMMGQESFGLAVCDEVPKSVVEASIGKPIEEVEDKSVQDSTGCTYYTNKDKTEHILIQVSYLSAENQKKGHEALGRTITTNSEIPIENFIALQEDGQINAIYLAMAPNKFVRIDRTANAASEDQLIILAKEVAKIITTK